MHVFYYFEKYANYLCIFYIAVHFVNVFTGVYKYNFLVHCHILDKC